MSNKLRSVNTKFWDDPFVEGLNPSEKLLFLYLLTNPLTKLIGIYEITLKRICYDTGLSKEIILKGFESFGKAKKAFLTEDNFIILPNWLKNQTLNANMKIAVSREFNSLPNHIRNSILTNGSECLPNDSEGFGIVLESLGKFNIKIKEEEEVKEPLNIDFILFWDLYDKKVGSKEKCEKKWNNLSGKERQKIIDTLPVFLLSITDKQFQPFPETYLNQKRWNDEIKNTPVKKDPVMSEDDPHYLPGLIPNPDYVEEIRRRND